MRTKIGQGRSHMWCAFEDCQIKMERKHNTSSSGSYFSSNWRIRDHFPESFCIFGFLFLDRLLNMKKKKKNWKGYCKLYRGHLHWPRSVSNKTNVQNIPNFEKYTTISFFLVWWYSAATMCCLKEQIWYFYPFRFLLLFAQQVAFLLKPRCFILIPLW